MRRPGESTLEGKSLVSFSEETQRLLLRVSSFELPNKVCTPHHQPYWHRSQKWQKLVVRMQNVTTRIPVHQLGLVQQRSIYWSHWSVKGGQNAFTMRRMAKNGGANAKLHTCPSAWAWPSREVSRWVAYLDRMRIYYYSSRGLGWKCSISISSIPCHQPDQVWAPK